MKIFLEGSCDFIIGGKFIANQKDGKPQFIDEQNKIVVGRRLIEYVSFHVQEDNGYEKPNRFLKVYLTKDDILRLAQEIKELEAHEYADELEDNLPF